MVVDPMVVEREEDGNYNKKGPDENLFNKQPNSHGTIQIKGIIWETKKDPLGN